MKLWGAMIQVPLVVKSIDGTFVSRMFVRATPGDDGVRIHALFDEGTFYCELTLAQIEELRNGKDESTSHEWTQFVTQALTGAGPLKLSGVLETTNRYDVHSHKLLDEEVDDLQLTVSIQSGARVPVRLGTFAMAPLHDDSEQQDVFTWLEDAVSMNETIKHKLEQCEQQRDQLKQEVAAREEEVRVADMDHRRILDDLQDKFYQVLTSKKMRIWQLEGRNPDELARLNETRRGLRRREANERAEAARPKRVKVEALPFVKLEVDAQRWAMTDEEIVQRVRGNKEEQQEDTEDEEEEVAEVEPTSDPPIDKDFSAHKDPADYAATSPAALDDASPSSALGAASGDTDVSSANDTDYSE